MNLCRVPRVRKIDSLEVHWGYEWQCDAQKGDGGDHLVSIGQQKAAANLRTVDTMMRPQLGYLKCGHKIWVWVKTY